MCSQGLLNRTCRYCCTEYCSWCMRVCMYAGWGTTQHCSWCMHTCKYGMQVAGVYRLPDIMHHAGCIMHGFNRFFLNCEHMGADTCRGIWCMRMCGCMLLHVGSCMIVYRLYIAGAAGGISSGSAQDHQQDCIRGGAG